MRNIRNTLYKKKKTPGRRIYNQIRRGLGLSIPSLTKKVLGKRPYAEIENEEKMARTRKFSRRGSRTSKRRGTSRRRPAKKSLSSKVYKIQKQLNGPTKYLFWAAGVTGSQADWAFNLNNASYQHLMTVAPRESTSAIVQARTGDKTYVTGIHIEAELRAGTSIAEDAYVYMLLVQQKKVDGGTTDFCLDYFGTSTPETYSQPNFNNDTKRANWRILTWKKVLMTQLVAGQMDRRKVNIGWKKKGTQKGLVVNQQLNSTGGISSTSTGAIYFVAYCPGITTGGAIGVNYVQMYGQARLYFKDCNVN